MPPKVRDLGKQLAIYGAGDVAVSAVNLLLLPIYVRFLSERDYGILGLLGAVEVIAKIFFRWGLDGSFMRFFYENDDEPGRQRLASTIFFFLLIVNGALLVASLAGSSWLARAAFDDPDAALPLRLVLLNTFAIALHLLPVPRPADGAALNGIQCSGHPAVGSDRCVAPCTRGRHGARRAGRGRLPTWSSRPR